MPVQLALEIEEPHEGRHRESAPREAPREVEQTPPAGSTSGIKIAEPAAEPLEFEAEPPELDPDPFAEIPGFTPVPPSTQEYVLLPGSLRSRLDLREFTRFLAALPTVVKDWDGAPEIDDGAVRLCGPAGGAWIYPETNRVRLTTDGVLAGSPGEDLVALCRWVEGRAGMRLYPAGEVTGAGVDRSLDPWETFLGR